MKQHLREIDSRISVLGACALGTAGVKVFALLPLLLGTIAEHLQLDDAATGMVASLYYIAYFVVTLTSVIWIRRANWRVLSMAGGGLMVLGLAGSATFSESYEGVILGMMLSGLGAAVVYALSVTLVSDMTDKDRRFAIKLIPEQIIPAALMFMLPVLVIDDFGLKGMLYVLALVIFVLALLSSGIPVRGRALTPDKTTKKAAGASVFIGLGALVVFFAGFAGLWAFTERLAHDALDPVVVGQLLALGLVSSAAGPFVAAIVGDRWGRITPIITGVVLSLISMLLLVGQITTFKFGLLMAVFPAAYYFSLAYLFGIISDADISGRFASLIASALALGAAVGPGVFGVILNGNGHNAAYLFAAIMMALGALMFIWMERRLERAHLVSFEGQIEHCPHAEISK
ncbi:MFS transporter [Pontibacterium sp.]|uniref:MFS transporter n=1 Tax=Pontibacterium sp. TaxID=2036026 RepID=UPI0035642119